MHVGQTLQLLAGLSQVTISKFRLLLFSRNVPEGQEQKRDTRLDCLKLHCIIALSYQSLPDGWYSLCSAFPESPIYHRLHLFTVGLMTVFGKKSTFNQPS